MYKILPKVQIHVGYQNQMPININKRAYMIHISLCYYKWNLNFYIWNICYQYLKNSWFSHINLEFYDLVEFIKSSMYFQMFVMGHSSITSTGKFNNHLEYDLPPHFNYMKYVKRNIIFPSQKVRKGEQKDYKCFNGVIIGETMIRYGRRNGKKHLTSQEEAGYFY